MQVTVKLSSREGAAHVSGILAGFTLLAKRGELTLRVHVLVSSKPLIISTWTWMFDFPPTGYR